MRSAERSYGGCAPAAAAKPSGPQPPDRPGIAIGRLARALAVLLLAGCGGGGGSGGDENVVAVSVNGALCDGNVSGFPNKLCVEVTVCAPGTTQCQAIRDILLDTGSFGLRVFRQALGSLALQQVPAGAGALATCVQFVDGSSDWGPVQVADVTLGKEPAVRVPIHVLDATFSTPPSSCPNPETGPATARFNGVLGVGVFLQDCGPGCAQSASNGLYFSCGASGCTESAAPLADQVQNPVALLPQDNNGVIVQLPAVPADGASSVEGSLLLGIGTRRNNGLAGTTTFPLNPGNGTLTTVLEGEMLQRSFFDTGSNGLFFAPLSASVLPACPSPNQPWFCPAATVSFTAQNTGFGGSPTGPVSLQIANAVSLFSSGHRVFSNLGGGSIPVAGFDFGLPFFLGRPVAVGFEERSSSLGTGPFVAY